SATASVP
ncbi:host specificity protein J, partial [Escherichia coli 5412]